MTLVILSIISKSLLFSFLISLKAIPKNIEKTIIDRAYERGWVVPKINKNKTNKKIAVVGSGPAGLSCAQQLARAGHSVHLFEKNDRIGGLLRYGIPNFKMEKFYINRRVNQMEKEEEIPFADFLKNYLNALN